MIRKLRIKLVAVSMLSLLVVLGAIVAAANIVSWKGIIDDSDTILGFLSENGGVFPERMLDFDKDIQNPGSFGMGKFAESGEPSEPPFPPDGNKIGGRDLRERRFSEETAFETRYFSVSFDSSGAVSEVDTSYIAAISESQAESYAIDVYQSGAEKGFKENYRFLSYAEEDGRRIIFLDRTREMETFRSFRTSSILIAAAGLAAVFLLITLLSARIVRPVSESYDKQKRFITDAGHEIKTPLAIIDADAEVLGMDIGDDNEWLTDIRKQTKRLAGLTADLIYLARMEEGAPAAKMIEFPLSDIASECARSFSGVAKSSGRTLDVVVTPMITMKGDEKAVTQLINILLDNAMKYSSDGGRVLLELSRSGKNIRLSVSNDAPPMAKDDIDHLFDRFYRADKSRSSSSGGHGIGLSVARAVAESHRGKITARQDENGVFSITAVFPQ